MPKRSIYVSVPSVAGIGLLSASVIAGFLWSSLGPSAPFLFGGCLAFVTCAGVFVVLGGGGKR